MKTPEQIFKETIDELGFSGWKQSEMSNSDNWLCTVTAMKNYAKQCCEEQIKACAKPYFVDDGIEQSLYSEILNTPNVVK